MSFNPYAKQPGQQAPQNQPTNNPLAPPSAPPPNPNPGQLHGGKSITSTDFSDPFGGPAAAPPPPPAPMPQASNPTKTDSGEQSASGYFGALASGGKSFVRDLESGANALSSDINSARNFLGTNDSNLHVNMTSGARGAIARSSSQPSFFEETKAIGPTILRTTPVFGPAEAGVSAASLAIKQEAPSFLSKIAADAGLSSSYSAATSGAKNPQQLGEAAAFGAVIGAGGGAVAGAGGKLADAFQTSAAKGRLAEVTGEGPSLPQRVSMFATGSKTPPPPVGGAGTVKVMGIGPKGEPLGIPPGAKLTGKGFETTAPEPTQPPRDLMNFVQDFEGRKPPDTRRGLLETEQMPGPPTRSSPAPATRPSYTGQPGTPFKVNLEHLTPQDRAMAGLQDVKAGSSTAKGTQKSTFGEMGTEPKAGREALPESKGTLPESKAKASDIPGGNTSTSEGGQRGQSIFKTEEYGRGQDSLYDPSVERSSLFKDSTGRAGSFEARFVAPFSSGSVSRSSLVGIGKAGGAQPGGGLSQSYHFPSPRQGAKDKLYPTNPVTMPGVQRGYAKPAIHQIQTPGQEGKYTTKGPAASLQTPGVQRTYTYPGPSPTETQPIPTTTVNTNIPIPAGAALAPKYPTGGLFSNFAQGPEMGGSKKKVGKGYGYREIKHPIGNILGGGSLDFGLSKGVKRSKKR